MIKMGQWYGSSCTNCEGITAKAVRKVATKYLFREKLKAIFRNDG